MTTQNHQQLRSSSTFYPFWVSNKGRRGWLTGPPCDGPHEAKAFLKDLEEGGTLIMGFVCEFHPTEGKRVMTNWILPKRERKAVLHYLELLEKLKK